MFLGLFGLLCFLFGCFLLRFTRECSYLLKFLPKSHVMLIWNQPVSVIWLSEVKTRIQTRT